MADCNHDCGSCSSDCAERDLIEKPLSSTHVKKIIGVVSGKGGVGKSSVTSMLAVALRREGYNVAIMDADITGPSIPRAFGATRLAVADQEGIIPMKTKTGIKLISMNNMLENDTDPVIWRGPVIGGAVKQFWTDVKWGDVDYMLVDMPPGTGDVALTVFQSLPIDGIVIVTTPQDLVGMIVEKAVKMAEMMDVPVLGMVENMSYFQCPDCGKQHAIFGISGIEAVAVKYGIDTVVKLPMDPKVAAACDRGMMELAEVEAIMPMAEALEALEGMEAPEPCDGNCDGCETPCELAEEEAEGKIAVAYEEGNVCEHFGHCPQFKIYTLKGLNIVESYIVENKGGHDSAVQLLLQEGVEVVITGNIGEQAAFGLAQAGILYLPGVAGNADEVMAQFVDGTLEYSYQDGGCGGHEGGGCGGCCGSCH